MRTELNLVRRVINGPTMGTRFSAVFFAPEHLDLVALRANLQQAVDTVDRQMSTWKPDSDLMRLNRVPVGDWIDIPEPLGTVLAAALEIGLASHDAFDIGVGDLVSAWGFGAAASAPDAAVIARASAVRHSPAHIALELDKGRKRGRKRVPITLDLSGIAKGYGVDELARVLEMHGVSSYLASIDGELRAGGPKPDGSAWQVAVESPQAGHRQAAGTIGIVNASLATSGDYRHFVERDGVRYAHTIDPSHQAPLKDGAASVTVLAPTCMHADAWATALMVLGPERGGALASALGLEVLFATREDDASYPPPSSPSQPLLSP